MRFAWVVMMIATPAVAADQFDLVCTSKRMNIHYRIDLRRGEWCFAECAVIKKVASVTSGTLLLESQSSDRRDRETQYQINRSTGEWVYYMADPNMTVSILENGSCKPAPFSGFPAAKF